MPKSNDSWGIEVGANALKAIRLVRKGEELTVADFAVIPFKKVLTTPDINADEQIQIALDEFMSSHPKLHQSTVVISAPGHAGIARFAKLPPVEPKKIPAIVKFEAEQQIPFPIADVEWDYQTFTQPDSPEVEVGIFAMTHPKVEAHLANFTKVGLKPDGLTLSPVAVFNAIVYDHDLDADAPGVVMVDIGTTSTDVIVHEGGKLWLRTLNNIGGNNFTEALIKAFKLSFPKAEKLKREASTSKYARQIFTAMRPVFADFVQELQRSLGYYQSLNREARLDKLIGLGSTFRLPGLQKFLKQQLQIDVVRPDGFTRLSIEGKRQADFAEHTINLATAYGCALQGLGLETVSANLLPTENVRQRVWAAKRPWFIGAAAAFALPVLIVGGTAFKMDREYTAASKENEALYSTINRKNGEFDRQVAEARAVADLEGRIDQYRRMLDYRAVWPKLLADIKSAAASINPDPNAAVYQPDYDALKNLSAQQRKRIYIEEIESQYEFGPDTMANDVEAVFNPPQDAFGGGGEMAGGGPGPMGPMGGGMGMGPGMGKKVPPTFNVTVRGFVSGADADGAEALRHMDAFVAWFEDHKDQPDRPYRLELPPKPGYVPAPVVRPTTTGGPGAAPMPGMMRPGGGAGGMWGGNTSITSPAGTAVVHTRPFNEKTLPGVWGYSLTLTVKLRPPNEARAADLGKLAPPATPSNSEGEETPLPAAEQPNESSVTPEAEAAL